MNEERYVILAHDHFTVHQAKTACSLLRYREEQTVAVLDHSQAGKTAQDVLGFGGAVPIVATLAEALALGGNHLVIGIANPGGVFPGEWRALVLECIDQGMTISNGLHAFLNDDPEFVRAAHSKGARLVDLRAVPKDLSTPDGSRERLTQPVVLTVGSDCSVGKMTVMLQVLADARKAGSAYGFLPTGQTGILLEGEGIAVDRVISDFVAGATERALVRAAQGRDLVLVEGQGSLMHPFFSGVTLGLLHGSQPDALILCHELGRTHIRHSHRPVAIPNIPDLIAQYEDVAGVGQEHESHRDRPGDAPAEGE